MKKVLSALLSIVAIFSLPSLIMADQSTLRQVDLSHVSQNNLDYDFDNWHVQPAFQAELSDNFLVKYFAPWEDYSRLYSIDDIKKGMASAIKKYQRNPGWGAHKQPHTDTWIEDIIANARWEQFSPNIQKAITLHNTDLRVLPTHEPSYTNWVDPGEGFPFDNLQESFVPGHVPVMILHTSADGGWVFVIGREGYGWLPSLHVALVDDEFIQQWQTGEYAVVTKEGEALYDAADQFYGYTRMGALYPLLGENTETFVTLVAVKDKNNMAGVQQVSMSKTRTKRFPIALTARNIAIQANCMVGAPYGWGGLMGYRDCSSTMFDLFTGFGLWLPRNTREQIHIGHYISLKNLTDNQKEQRVIDKGIPFLTLIHLPGHTMLYIGTHEGKAYAFQTIWGLRTYTEEHGEGRTVVGKTIIAPLNFGQGETNVSRSLLRMAEAMTILLPPEAFVE